MSIKESKQVLKVNFDNFCETPTDDLALDLIMSMTEFKNQMLLERLKERKSINSPVSTN
jgi:hypothetical protein